MPNMMRWNPRSSGFKWFYLLAVVLGLAAIVAIVFLVVRSGWLVDRLGRQSNSDNHDDPDALDYDI